MPVQLNKKEGKEWGGGSSAVQPVVPPQGMAGCPIPALLPAAAMMTQVHFLPLFGSSPRKRVLT